MREDVGRKSRRLGLQEGEPIRLAASHGNHSAFTLLEGVAARMNCGRSACLGRLRHPRPACGTSDRVTQQEPERLRQILVRGEGDRAKSDNAPRRRGAHHNITAEVEIIPIQQINEAYERMAKSDVKYRFSIDMSSLKGE